MFSALTAVRFRASALLFLCALAFSPAWAAPFIFHRGILNAASFHPPGLPNGSLARGSIFTIFGRELGPAEGVPVSSFPLADALGGVSIEVCRGDSCVAAIPLFVRTDQINAILPSNTPLGPVSIRVRFNGESGNFSPAEVVESSVGLFSVSSSGAGPGVIQNFVSQSDLPVNSGLAAARRGQVVTLWATGLGPALNSDNVAPQVGDLPLDVEIWVGAAQVTNKLYSGRSRCCAGVDQINFEVPADAPEGCWVPVHVRTNGRFVSNAVTMAVGPNGSCSDPHNPFQPILTSGGRLAAFHGDGFETAADVEGLPARTDLVGWAQLYLRAEQPGGFAYDRILSTPPPGACATQGLAGDYVRNPLPPTPPSLGWLDSGPSITLAIGDDAATVPASPAGAGAFGAGAVGPSATFLAAGSEVRFATGGGSDLGPLEGALAAGPRLTWTNQAGVREITAGEPLPISWSAPDATDRTVSIVGVSVDVNRNATGRFHCVADAAAGSFTVPGWATANLPRAGRRLYEADAVVAIGLSTAGSVSGAGLDAGFSLSTSWAASTVTVKGAAE